MVKRRTQAQASAFIPPMLPIKTAIQKTPVFKDNGPKLSGRIRNAANFIDSVAPGVLPAIQDAIITKGANVVNDGINKIRTGKSPLAKSNEPNPTIVFPQKQVEGNFSYALSGAPSPKSISLNSGVKPDTFVSDYMYPIENVCSPLHVSNVYLGIPTAVTHPIYIYFINNVAFNIQAKAQQASTFLLDVTTSTAFTAANILAAINDGIYALQVYFFYSSILSYDSDSKNKNSGMDAIRSLIDAQTLSDYYQLGKRLEDTPLPPKLVEWVRYMSGNYKSGNNAGAPMIKICFFASALTGARPSPTWPAAALTNLNRNNNLGVWTLMRKAFPNWRIGKLADIPVKPLYDKQFLTIFANLVNTQRSSGANVTNNVVANVNTSFQYNSFTNYLDGLAFAMTNCTDGTLNYPGLCGPTTVNASFPDNRYSYYKVGSTVDFYPVYAYPFLGVSRQETSTQLLTTAYAPHLYGTDRCQNVTGAALCNTAQEVIDFMFETQTTLKLGLNNSFKYK